MIGHWNIHTFETKSGSFYLASASWDPAPELRRPQGPVPALPGSLQRPCWRRAWLPQPPISQVACLDTVICWVGGAVGACCASHAFHSDRSWSLAPSTSCWPTAAKIVASISLPTHCQGYRIWDGPHHLAWHWWKEGSKKNCQSEKSSGEELDVPCNPVLLYPGKCEWVNVCIKSIHWMSKCMHKE